MKSGVVGVGVFYADPVKNIVRTEMVPVIECDEKISKNAILGADLELRFSEDCVFQSLRFDSNGIHLTLRHHNDDFESTSSNLSRCWDVAEQVKADHTTVGFVAKRKDSDSFDDIFDRDAADFRLNNSIILIRLRLALGTLICCAKKRYSQINDLLGVFRELQSLSHTQIQTVFSQVSDDMDRDDLASSNIDNIVKSFQKKMGQFTHLVDESDMPPDQTSKCSK